MKINPTRVIRSNPSVTKCQFRDIPAGEWFSFTNANELCYKVNDDYAAYFSGNNDAWVNTVLLYIRPDREIVLETVEIHTL